MKRYFIALSMLLALIGILTLPRAALADSVVGDGTPESCTESALEQALAQGGNITFNCGTEAHTILFSSQKVITTTTSIEGDGLITLSGNSATRHFVVNPNSTLSLYNITLRDGASENGGNGGAVQNNGGFTTQNVTFTRNIAVVGAGAVYNNGVSQLQNTHFIENYAATGGALYNTITGTVSITTGTFLSNTALTPDNIVCAAGWGGGAIHNDGDLTYNGGLVANNQTVQSDAMSCGGGMANYGSVAMRDVEWSSNHAYIGSGLISYGTAVIERSRFIGNGRGANGSESVISAESDSTLSITPMLTIRNSEVLSNTGFGLYVGETALYVETSTIAHNTDEGAHLKRPISAMFVNSTLSNNVQGITVVRSTVPIRLINTTLMNTTSNLRIDIVGTIQLQNTVLAGTVNGNCAGLDPTTRIVESEGYNLADDATCPLTKTTDYLNANPLLGDLQANGGDTDTHLPDATSPLLDHGLCLGFVTEDQRGIPRPQGATCDIGAVERRQEEATPTPTPSATPTGTLTITPSATPTGTLTATPTGTPPIVGHHLHLPLVQR